jgi:hypothetical protein
LYEYQNSLVKLDDYLKLYNCFTATTVRATTPNIPYLTKGKTIPVISSNKFKTETVGGSKLIF